MQPRVVILCRHAQDAQLGFNLPLNENVIAIHYDGSHYSDNESFFKDSIFETVSKHI